MRKYVSFVFLICAFFITGCSTSMVTVQDKKMENGILICYNEMYVVPQRVADDDKSIRDYIEKNNIQPREKNVKPC